MKRKIVILSLIGALSLGLLAQAAPAQATTLTISSPLTNAVIQRDQLSGMATVNVSGMVNPATAVEVSRDGVSWTTATLSGTSYNAVLTGVPVGRYTISARLVNTPATVVTVSNVGIGDNFAIIGDSNALGLGLNLQTYTGSPGQVSLLTNARVWKSLKGDPVDVLDEDTGITNCQWILLVCLRHSLYDQGQGGSIWPLVGSRLSAAHPGLPIGLIVMARGGSFLTCDPAVQNWTCWQKPTGYWANDRWKSLYADMAYRLQALGASNLRAVIWFEGVNDVFKNNLNSSAANYRSYLQRLVNSLVTDFGPLQVMISQPGDCNPSLYNACANLDAGMDNVRSAVTEAWSTMPNVARGPVLNDISKADATGSDGLHYKSDTSSQAAASRLTLAMEAAFYGGQSQVGPVLTSAQQSAGVVNLHFDGADLTPGQSVDGITLKASGTTLTVTPLASSTTDVVASLPSGTTAAVSVSVETGRTGQASNIVRDSRGLPAEVVIDRPLTQIDPDTTPPTGSVIIGGGASQTTASTVTLSLNGNDDQTVASNLQVKVSNLADLSDATWQPFASSLNWPLMGGVGLKTVYAKLRDQAGNESVLYNDQIELVTTLAPVKYIGGSVKLNGSYDFGIGIKPADLFGNRGNVYYGGTWTARNDISRCGAGCVQGSAVTLFKPTLYWKVDTAANTVTLNGVSYVINTGTITITP